MTALLLSSPSSPVSATVAVPGSKSYTNRALIMAALADGVTTLTGCSPSQDSSTLIRALRLLGVSIETPDTSTIIVTGTNGRLYPYHGIIDVGPAGTTMRFLTALCSAIQGADIILQGSERMHARPIKPLVETLQRSGAAIEYLGTEGCPPLRIHSDQPLCGRDVRIDGATSSQFVSALLLISPLFADPFELSITGKPTSTSYIDMTVQGMHDFGIAVKNTDHRHVHIPACQHYSARTYQIDGDTSGASYLWALAAVSGGSITVENVNPNSAQGDVRFPQLLERMGCTVTSSSNSITVKGCRNLTGIDVDMELMPDTAQTLAVVAAFARGTTVLRGLHTLRIKETDRIAALHNELGKLGIKSSAGADFLVIHGGQPHCAQISTYDDHRMAMSFSVCAAILEGMIIEHPEVVEKSFPSYWQTLAHLGITSKPT